MAKKYSAINKSLEKFIKRQRIFFVGTAANDGRVNVSPKGMDTFRVLGENEVAWLNLTGSGNETAAHLLANDRMTIMFCAFEKEPLILRLYGHAGAVHPRNREWKEMISLFPPMVGARQVMKMKVDLVQTSCGFAVPHFAYRGERDLLKRWAEKKGDDGLLEYWKEKNRISLDGKPTDILG